MPTTTNFGWTTPADTDLVKDGASAIRTLGNGIDTSFLDLKGGTTGQILSKASNTDLDYTWINNDQGDITEVVAGTGISGGGTSGSVTITNSMATAIDAKGDLVAGTGADAFSRLAVGANDTVLTADSSTATGLKWAAVASGGRTLINTGGTSMNGVSSISISSIPSTYQSLFIVIDDFNGAGSGNLLFRPNANTSAVYVYANWSWSANNSLAQSAQIDNSNGFLLASGVWATTFRNALSIQMDNYNSTTAGKPILAYGVTAFQSTSNQGGFLSAGGWYAADAVSTVQFVNSSGNNWTSGMIYVYGVK